MTTYSRALPEAMGYTVTLDEFAGEKMFVRRDDRPHMRDIWNPKDDAGQNDEVQCWLLWQKRTHIDHNGVTVWHSNDILICDIDHTNTPASLRAAIVEAAERVADAKGDK